MSPEEIQKLLGGYATDTLNEEERSALFEAALEDQELFDALAKEQALRDVLQDPSAREQLIEALGPAGEPIAGRAWHWLGRPTRLAMALGVVALLLVGGLALWRAKLPARREALVADAIVPQPAQIAPPAAAPERSDQSRIILQRKLFRLPAARTTGPPAPLPAPPALPAQSALTAQAPLPATRPAMAVGALAGAAGDARQMNQPMQPPIMGFTSRNGAPRAALKKAKATPLGYTLLLKGADGAYLPVPLGTVFHAGDSVRLQVEPQAAGYIYLYRRNAGGGWDLIASQSVEKGQGYVLPTTGGLQSDVPAQVEFLLVLSPVEQELVKIMIEFR